MTGGAHQKLKILLVEDDPHVRACFESLLEFDGHEVRAVDSGGAALAVLEHGKFDLVITDYWMLGMKGDELAGLVKQRWPNLPVILASGSLSDPDALSSTPAIDCLLNKPFSIEELRESITWALAQYADRGLDAPGITGLAADHGDDPETSSRPPEQ